MSAADSGIVDRAAGRLYLHRLFSDHRFFVTELWKDRKLDRVAPLSDIELDMVDFGFSGPRLRGILGARGTGKTTCITAPLTVYRGFRAHFRFLTHGVRCLDRKILMVSKSGPAAKETIGLCREWIDHVWFLRHLAPQSDQSDTTTYFDFGPAVRGGSKQPSVKAIGVDGQLEGNRAHTILPDDAETKNNTKTLEAREDLRRLCGEFRNVLYPEAPGAIDKAVDPTEICYIGTIKHEDSLYKDRSKRGYTFRTYPLAAPAKGDKFLNLAPIIQHKLESGAIKWTEGGNYQLSPLFPARFGEQDIAEKMAEGRHEFAMEHMLISDLDNSTRYPLRLADLIVHDVHRDRAPVTITWGRRDHNGETIVKNVPCLGLPGDSLHFPIAVDREVAPFVTTKACIDPAGVGQDKAGLAIAGLLNGIYHVKHCRGHPGGVGETELYNIALELRRHGAREVFVETNIDVFDTYIPLLEVQIRRLHLKPGEDPAYPDGWTCTVIGFHATGMKEERICDVLAPIFGSHRAVFSPAVLTPQPDEEERETLQYQLSRIQRIRKCLKEEGAADALASLFARFQASTAGVRTDSEKQRHAKVTTVIKTAIAMRQRALGIKTADTRIYRHH